MAFRTNIDTASISTKACCKWQYSVFLLPTFILLLALPAQASGLLGGVAMDGYDPVDYHVWGITVKGDEEFFYPWDHMVYYFDTKENLDKFMEEPERYAPQYGGHCAYHASIGRIIPANPKIWAIYQKKLYLFLNKASYAQWKGMMRLAIPRGLATWMRYTSPLPFEQEEKPVFNPKPVVVIE